MLPDNSRITTINQSVTPATVTTGLGVPHSQIAAYTVIKQSDGDADWVLTITFVAINPSLYVSFGLLRLGYQSVLIRFQRNLQASETETTINGLLLYRW